MTSKWRMVLMFDQMLIIGKADANLLSFSPKPFNLLALCQQLRDEANMSHACHQTAGQPARQQPLIGRAFGGRFGKVPPADVVVFIGKKLFVTGHQLPHFPIETADFFVQQLLTEGLEGLEELLKLPERVGK